MPNVCWTMTPAELREAMERLGLSNGTVAQLCGVGPGVVARWRQEQSKRYALPVPRYAQTILSLLTHVKALEAHYDTPAASRLSVASRSRP